MTREERKQYNYNQTHKTIKGIEYKKCSKCKEWKPMTEEFFYKWKHSTLDEFHAQCKECQKEDSKRRKKAKREHYLVLDHNWKMRNKEHVRKYNREYKEKFPEKKKEALIRFFENNPDKLKEYYNNHRQHDISTKEWNSVLEVFGHKCIYCGITEEEAKDKYKQKLHKDHADPEGHNDIRNAVPACRGCNDSKWKTELEKWFREQEFFSEERLKFILWWTTEGYKDYIENKPPYRVTRTRIYNEDGTWNFEHEIWSVDEKRNLVECIGTGKKKQDVIKLWNDKFKNQAV
jgi:hypothetical protein